MRCPAGAPLARPIGPCSPPWKVPQHHRAAAPSCSVALHTVGRHVRAHRVTRELSVFASFCFRFCLFCPRVLRLPSLFSARLSSPPPLPLGPLIARPNPRHRRPVAVVCASISGPPLSLVSLLRPSFGCSRSSSLHSALLFPRSDLRLSLLLLSRPFAASFAASLAASLAAPPPASLPTAPQSSLPCPLSPSLPLLYLLPLRDPLRATGGPRPHDPVLGRQRKAKEERRGTARAKARAKAKSKASAANDTTTTLSTLPISATGPWLSSHMTLPPKPAHALTALCYSLSRPPSPPRPPLIHAYAAYPRLSAPIHTLCLASRRPPLATPPPDFVVLAKVLAKVLKLQESRARKRKNRTTA